MPTGDGIWRSVDGGLSFTQIVTASTYPALSIVNDLVHDPIDPNTLYAGTNDGVWRSVDGGFSWMRIRAAGDPARDLEIHPSGALLVAISAEGIYRAANPRTATEISGWVDESWGWLPWTAGRIVLAACAMDPDRVYALIGDTYTGNYEYIYHSTNGGRDWDPKDGTGMVLGSTYDGYTGMLGVNQYDCDMLFAGGVRIRRSTNGGDNWELPLSFVPTPHEDYHVLVQHPAYSGGCFIGNDGGIVEAQWDPATWQRRNNDYAVTQFYGGDYDIDGDTAIGGTQDNGTLKVALNYENKCGGADGGFSYAHPTRPDTAYIWKRGGKVRMIGLIDDFNSANPSLPSDTLNMDPTMYTEGYDINNFYIINRADGEQIYCLTNDGVWRRPDHPSGWTKLTGSITYLTTIACEDALDPTLYIGGYGGKLYRIDNAVTDPTGSEFKIDTLHPDMDPFDNIASITIHPDDKDIIYVTYGNIAARPRILRYDDATTASPKPSVVSGDLPLELPVNTLALHPIAPTEVMFAGTDFGLFYTIDGGDHWVKDERFPNVPIQQLKIRPSDRKMFAFTFGRGIWMMQLDECTSVTPPYGTSFESPLLPGWQQATDDDFDWTHFAGTTPTAGTGPVGPDHGFYYLYAEANGHKNEKASLDSPPLNLPTTFGVDMEYKYHMHGSHIDRLTLEVSTDCGHTWVLADEHIGSTSALAWYAGSLDLRPWVGEQHVVVRFTAHIGKWPLFRFRARQSRFQGGRAEAGRRGGYDGRGGSG